MANKYTRFVPSEYVPQYQPVNMGIVGEVLSDARDRRESAELSDVRQQATMQNAIGEATSPEEKALAQAIFDRYAPSIEKRQGKGYSSRDLLRTQLDAEKATNALTSIQEAREAKATWSEEFRELNQENISDPEKLAFWEQYYSPDIEYDAENLRARVTSRGTPRIAPDVNLIDKTKTYASEVVKDIDKYTDANGNVFFGNTSSVSPERIQASLDMAFAADPEIQAYRERELKYNTLIAEQQGGTETLESIKERTPKESLDNLEEVINTGRNKGLSDSEIAGQILTDSEIRKAQGFGETAYAFREFNKSYKTAKEEETDEKSSSSASRLSQTGALNNMYVSSLPDNLTIDSLPAAQETRLKELQNRVLEIRGVDTPSNTYYSNRSGFPTTQDNLSDASKAELEELNKEIEKIEASIKIFENDTPIEEQANTEQAKEVFGDFINRLIEENPRKHGEDNDTYKDRINRIYSQAVNHHRSSRGYLHTWDNTTKEGREALENVKQGIFGDRLSETPGFITNTRIFPTGPEGDGEPMNYRNWVTEELGLPLNVNTKEELLDNMGVVGEFKGNDPNIPSGYIVEYYGDDEVQRFKVEDPDVRNQAKFEPLRKITEYKVNPKLTDHTLEITDRTGRPVKLDFTKEGRYIGGTYRGERIGFKLPEDETFTARDGTKIEYKKGDIIWENTPIYQEVMKGIIGIDSE